MPELSSSSPGHAHGHSHGHSHGHEHAHGVLTLDERHDHEAQTYDEMARLLLAQWRDADYLVSPDQIPFVNREHVDFLTDAVQRLGPLAGGMSGLGLPGL